MSVAADEIEERYSGEYERHLDPFRNFNLQEKQRKYGQLRTHDKATLGIVSVSNRLNRHQFCSFSREDGL